MKNENLIMHIHHDTVDDLAKVWLKLLMKHNVETDLKEVREFIMDTIARVSALLLPVAMGMPDHGVITAFAAWRGDLCELPGRK